MTDSSTPVLDSRTSAGIVDELIELRPAWTPELVPLPGDPTWALFQIFGRYAQIVLDRLNQAPDKNLLAFLDMLGISLIPAKPARAPVVFVPVPNAADAIVPAGTRLGAKVPGRSEPLIYETEETQAIAAAKLTDLFTLWPARDEYTDHSPQAVTAPEPFTLFQPPKPVPHEFYLAHDTLFAFSGRATLEIEFELSAPGSKPMTIGWEFWDGNVWRPFREFDPANPDAGRDGTNGFTRSGIVSLKAECGESKKTKVNEVEAHWIRGRATEPLPTEPGRAWPMVDRIRVRSVILAEEMSAFAPETAFADALKLDIGKAFYPFDQQPKPGSALYLNSEPAFAKPGARVTLDADDSATPLESNYTITQNPTLAMEYWNGRSWQNLDIATSTLLAFAKSGTSFQFTVPADIAKGKVNEQEGYWVRIGIVAKTFAAEQEVKFTDSSSSTTNTLKLVTTIPPALQNLRITYTYRSPWHRPDHCLTFHDFQWTVHSDDIRWPGNPFPAFRDIADTTAAVYFGFDRPLPNDTVGIFLDIIENPKTAPRLVWEAWNGTAWVEVTVEDSTGGFSRPGLVRAIAPALSVPAETALLARFGTPRAWLRARLKEDGAPLESTVGGVWFNAAWAAQLETVAGEVLGGSRGVPNQTFFFTRTSILPGEEIEVRELEGARAHVEFPILQDELLSRGFTTDDLRTVVDPRTGKVREVWVRWRGTPHFYFSGPDDRHYLIERARGRLIFGDGLSAKIPPAGTGNIRAKLYRAGGGSLGNVPAGAISQIMSGVLAQGVSNPRSAEGGADGEVPEAAAVRGPNVLRHRERSLSAADYEALAKEASPAVAAARLLPATHANGRPAPGWVTLAIVPHSADAQPQPSYELRQQVHAYIAARAPATLPAEHISVIGPKYLAIGISALLIPRDLSDAGRAQQGAVAALARFLHPLTGGPEGRGWPFGRGVYQSDVAAILENIPGVDHVEQLQLRLDDIPAGDSVEVAPDRMVVAGPIRIEVRGI